jgi:poly(glycerol-phosphate) alpha-glucosyltransferase
VKYLGIAFLLIQQSLYNVLNYYKTVFNNLTRYKAIVVSTEKQCQDISQYIENKIPVINL